MQKYSRGQKNVSNFVPFRFVEPSLSQAMKHSRVHKANVRASEETGSVDDA